MHNSLNLESKHVTKTNKKDDANREVGTPVGSYPSSFWQISGWGVGQVMPATLLLSPNPPPKKKFGPYAASGLNVEQLFLFGYTQPLRKALLKS